MRKQLIISFGIFALALSVVKAQDTTLNTTVRVDRYYVPSVAKAVRKIDLPQVKDTVPPSPKLNYEFIRKQHPTSVSLDTIKPARIKGLPLSRLDRAYVRAGLGTLTSTMFDGYLNSVRSRKHALGVRFQHMATSGDQRDVGPGAYSTNSLRLHGRKFLKTHKLSAAFEANRDAFRYYGYDPDDPALEGLNKDNTKQTLMRIGGNVGIQSFLKDSADFNHRFRVGYYNLQDNYDASENNVLFDSRLNKYFGNGEEMVVDLTVDYNSFSDSAEQFGSTIIRFNPYVVTTSERFRAVFGVLANIDQGGKESTFHFNIKANASYNLVSDVLIPYAGITGGVQRNSLRTLTDENPYLNTQNLGMGRTFPLQNRNDRFNIYGGIKGAFSSRTTFTLQAARIKAEDMPLFYNDTTVLGNNRFAVAFDTVTYTQLTAEASFRKGEKINILARGDYFIYDTQHEFEAWHRPVWKATLTGNYDMQDKIIVRADFFFIAGQLARTYDPTDDESYGNDIYGKRLKGTADLNLGVEYRYTQRLSAFLNFNNIASVRYNRWNNFPTQGFTVLGGFTYSFWGD